MKRIITLKTLSIQHLLLLFVAGIFCIPLSAINSNDTIFYHDKNGKKTYWTRDSKIGRNKKHYYDLYLDFGHNQVDHRNLFTGREHTSAADFPDLNYARSRSFAMYAMYGMKFTRSLSLMSGLGIEWHNYRFTNNMTIREIDGMVTQTPIAAVVGDFSKVKRTKFTTTYLNVPLMLRLHFNRFFVAAGVFGGYNIGSHTKIVFNDANGSKHKHKDYNMRTATFEYGYTVRAGWRCIALFTHYYLNPLFDKDKGPQVYPFTIGVSLKL
jgi:hypothetical protein